MAVTRFGVVKVPGVDCFVVVLFCVVCVVVTGFVDVAGVLDNIDDVSVVGVICGVVTTSTCAVSIVVFIGVTLEGSGKDDVGGYFMVDVLVVTDIVGV